MSGLYPLRGVIKHYDWGGKKFLPSLLAVENTNDQPFAEYWMGTHPSGMAVVETANAKPKPLNEYITGLPYLFKVLDVRDMLSIQVHPSKHGAEEGFSRENIAGVPMDAPGRNYKDDNHKPELMVALSDFFLLHGFKPGAQLTAVIESHPSLQELLPILSMSGYGGLYRYIMELPQADVNRILEPIVNQLSPRYTGNKPDRSDEAFWAMRARETFCKAGYIDRGIFSIYFFNIVQLKKGEGIYQAPGVPHAYLEGQNVEIMANSDNVLRGGLTSKYIDVTELLKHVSCMPTVPVVIQPDPVNPLERIYETPASEFLLSTIHLKEGELTNISPASADILIITEGEVILKRESTSIILKPGHPSAILFPGGTIEVNAKKTATVFRASMPLGGA